MIMAPVRKSRIDPKESKNRQAINFKRQKLHKAYYSAADVLWRLNKKSGSLNSLMNEFRGDKCIKMIYALAVKVLKKHDIISKIIDKLPNYDENQLNSYLIEILIAELLYGEKSFLKYRLKNEVKFVVDNKKAIINLHDDIQKKTNDDVTSDQTLIRYVRINLLKNTKTEFLEKLKELGFVEKPWPRSFSFDQFKEAALAIGHDEFMMDFHFDDVILFNDQSTKRLTESELYQKGFIAMQDKSSLLAIEAMQLEENMKIMDACAAPGMKTAAIASRLNNQCTLYANDKDKKRFQEMKQLLGKSGVKFKSITQDFTQLDPAKYPDLDILLLDPSCSGSGINRRLEYKSTTAQHSQDDADQTDADAKRLEKLAKFQLAILQSALAFNAKKIIYCTCSKYQTENENVINSLLETNPGINYTIIDPLPTWTGRGQGGYGFSSKCLRADYENSLTNGFFCCVLQRNDLNVEEPILPNVDDQKDPEKTKARRKRRRTENSFTVSPL